MKIRVAVLSVIAFIAIVLLTRPWNHETPEPMDVANPAVQDPVETGEASLSKLEGPTHSTGPRTVLAGEKPPAPPEDPEPSVLDEEDEDPGTGTIVGQILDGYGARFEQGRVLVFKTGEFAAPLQVLELQGDRMEFKTELVANKAYRLMVDPESLTGDHIPAPLRHGADPKDPTGYSMAFVHVVRDREHVQNVRVGLPASVHGRLLDGDGKAIAGALARLAGLNKHFVGLSRDAITGDDGTFEFADVYPGEYRLTFSRKQQWTPPQPLDIAVLGGESHGIGNVRAGGGNFAIRGQILDQDGQPFVGLPVLCYSDAAVNEGLPAHNMGSALAHGTTGADGTFHLQGLPGIPVQVSLTPGFDPRKVGGKGHPAMWVPNLSVDLGSGLAMHDVGSHQVEESRPFEITGRMIFDSAWLAKKSNRSSDFQGHVSRIPGQVLPDGVLRTTLRRKTVDFDPEEGTFRCLVETPNTEVEVRFELDGQEDLVFVLQPVPLGSWYRDVRVPGDFLGAGEAD